MINITIAKHVAGHVLDMAKASGTHLPAYEVARKNMDVVEEHAGKSGDLDGIYGAIRVASNLKYTSFHRHPVPLSSGVDTPSS